jgi:hypothetical protein
MVTTVASFEVELYNQDVGNCSEVILISIKEFYVAGRKSSSVYG